MEPTSHEPAASGPVDLDDNTKGAPAVPDPAGSDRLERAHISLRDAVERLLAEARHGDFVEAADLVRHATHLLQGLDPQALEPRRGLAGLFDGRGARLKHFRALYLPAAASAADTAAALAERARSAVRRSAALDSLHAEAVRAITEADAALAEGEARLREATIASPSPPAPAEADAPSEILSGHMTTASTDAPLPGPEARRSEPVDAPEPPESTGTVSDIVEGIDREAPETSTVEVEAPDTPLPGPEAGRSEILDGEEALAAALQLAADNDGAGSMARLAGQLSALRAARTAGIAQLPLTRTVQNAEHAAPDQMTAAAAALSTWVEDWRQGLGLTGRKPRKIRPDGVALARTRDAALAAMAQTDRHLAAIRARAGETESRMTRVVEQVRRAA